MSDNKESEKNRFSKTHYLKVYPRYFQMMKAGLKPWEIRINDRGYQVNEVVILKEWHEKEERYSGSEAIRVITNIIYKAPGLKKGYVWQGVMNTNMTSKGVLYSTIMVRTDDPQQRFWNFDAWDNAGKPHPITIEALNAENATIIFKAKHEDLGFDPPY